MRLDTGNLHQDDRENGRDCWRIAEGNNFRVRSKHFYYNKSKIPAGKHLMDLVAVDYLIGSRIQNEWTMLLDGMVVQHRLPLRKDTFPW